MNGKEREQEKKLQAVRQVLLNFKGCFLEMRK